MNNQKAIIEESKTYQGQLSSNYLIMEKQEENRLPQGQPIVLPLTDTEIQYLHAMIADYKAKIDYYATW